MNRKPSPLRWVVLPFVVRSLVLVGGYAALRLILDVRMNAAGGITREMWELWMPIALAAIFCLLVMRVRFGLLRPARKDIGRENRFEALYWIAGIALTVSMFASQKYIASQTRDLVQVDSLSAVGDPRAGDCFRIGSNYIIDTERAGFLSESRGVPKRHGMDELDLIIYAALPMRESDADLIRMVPTGEPDIYEVLGITPAKYWFVKEYEQRVERPTGANIEAAHNRLADRVIEDLSSGALRRFDHLSVAPRTEHTRSMLAAVENSTMRATSDPVILLPETKPFARSDDGLWGALIAWGVAVLTVGVFALFYPLSETRLAEMHARAARSLRERFNLGRLALAVKKGSGVATWALVGLNVLYFLVVVAAGISPISPSPDELFLMGGATTDAILGGETWRILTSMFLHSGVFHLMYNMLTLFMIGMMVEPTFRSAKYTVVYVGSGVGAALLSMALLNPVAVHVGASGAIFGIMGAMWRVWARNRKKHKDYPLLFFCFGGISLVLGLFIPSVNNWAHIGGLATGFVLGMLLYVPPKKRRKPSLPKKVISD